MATAHVLLRVTDVGALGCPTVGADTLIVRPPGYPLIVKGESDQLGFYPLRLCTNKVTMSTTPVGSVPVFLRTRRKDGHRPGADKAAVSLRYVWLRQRQ